MPLRWAMLASAWLSSSSVMRMPERSPICSWMFSMIRRSSTCWLRTSSGGSAAPRLAMVCCTSRTRASSWLCMITSLSTMATTRLRGCTSACAAAPRNSAPSSSGRTQSESLIFTFTITLNALIEESLNLVACHATQTFEDDLQENAAVRLIIQRRIQADFVIVDPVAIDQAQLPAAVVILETAEGFEGAITSVIVLPARDHAPLRDDRPDHREVMLADLVVVLDVVRGARGAEVAATNHPVTGSLVEADGVVAVAITGIDHLVRVVFRLVVEHRAARAGAAGVQVPVEVRGEAPVAVEAIQVLQSVRRLRGLGVITGAVVDARHLHLAVFEVEGLADAEALTLETVALDPAVGQAQRQLVLVADAVLAGETVLAEQRRITEVALASVEDRNVGLVFLGDIEVEQPWLQGLAVGLAEQGGVVPRLFGHALFIDEAAVAQVAVEAHQFAAVAEVQASRLERQGAVQGDLRQAVVRRDIGDIGQFVGVRIEARGIAAAAIGQGAALVDVGGGIDAEIGVQVLEVIGIADVGVVDFGQQARVEAALVLPAVEPALVFVVRLQFAVVVAVVEVSRAKLAFAALGQVTTLAFDEQAAVAHVGRIERGVVVRRQVEVIGRLQRHAVIAGAADARRQEAGLTTVVNREVDVGGVENREVLHPQGHVGRSTEAGRRVQGDVVALQVPGVTARFTGGVGAVFQADNRGFFALGVECTAAYMAFVQHVFGVVDLGFAVVQLQFGAITDYQHALIAQAHVADQFAAVLRLVQAGFVGLDLHAGLAQHHIAGQGGDLLFLLVARGFGGNEQRRLIHRRLVVHPWPARLDIAAGTVGADFRQLCFAQVLAGHPVEVAVVGATRSQGFAAAVRDQRGAGGSTRVRTVRALGRGRAAGAWRNMRRRALRYRSTGGFRGACPTPGSGYLAVELLGSDSELTGQRL